MELHLLQFGIPGGPELLVILTMLVMMGLPLLLVVLAVVAGVKLLGGSDEERIRELEQRVARLEGQVDSGREATGNAVDSGGDTGHAPGGGSESSGTQL